MIAIVSLPSNTRGVINNILSEFLECLMGPLLFLFHWNHIEPAWSFPLIRVVHVRHNWFNSQLVQIWTGDVDQ